MREPDIHLRAAIGVVNWAIDYEFVFGRRPSIEEQRVRYEEFRDELRGYALIEGEPVTPALPPAS